MEQAGPSVVRSGWLSKLGQYTGFKNRWFVLEGKKLHYYKTNDKKEKATDTIPLHEAIIPLCAGIWKESVDSMSRTYFWDEITGATSWEKPLVMAMEEVVEEDKSRSAAERKKAAAEKAKAKSDAVTYNEFQIIIPGRIYYLRAPDRATLFEWLKAFLMVEPTIGHNFEKETLVKKALTNELYALCEKTATPVEVQNLLNRKADPNLTVKNGASCLIPAAFQGDPVVVDILLVAHADPNLRDDESRTPLMEASSKGNHVVVEKLIAHKALVNTRANDGKSPLWLAAANGHSGCVEVLLRHNADIAAVDRGGRTSLDIAKFNNKSNKVVMLLQEATAAGGAAEWYAQVLKKRNEGSANAQALYSAAREGDVAWLKRLLAMDPDTFTGYAPAEGEDVALILAIKKGGEVGTEIALCLLQARANPDAMSREPLGNEMTKNLSLRRASASASKRERSISSYRMVGTSGKYSALSLSIDAGLPSISKALIQAGANVITRDQEFNSLLHSECSKGHAEIVKALIDAGCDASAVNGKKNTPLFNCVLDSQLECAQVLLESKKVNIETVGEYGETVLLCAIRCNRRDFVELFLRAGANIEAMNLNGMRSLHYAACYGFVDLIELLLRNGADVFVGDQDKKDAIDWANETGRHDAATMLIAAKEAGGGRKWALRVDEERMEMELETKRQARELQIASDLQAAEQELLQSEQRAAKKKAELSAATAELQSQADEIRSRTENELEIELEKLRAEMLRREEAALAEVERMKLNLEEELSEQQKAREQELAVDMEIKEAELLERERQLKEELEGKMYILQTAREQELAKLLRSMKSEQISGVREELVTLKSRLQELSKVEVERMRLLEAQLLQMEEEGRQQVSQKLQQLQEEERKLAEERATAIRAELAGYQARIGSLSDQERRRKQAIEQELVALGARVTKSAAELLAKHEQEKQELVARESALRAELEALQARIASLNAEELERKAMLERDLRQAVEESMRLAAQDREKQELELKKQLEAVKAESMHRLQAELAAIRAASEREMEEWKKEQQKKNSEADNAAFSTLVNASSSQNKDLDEKIKKMKAEIMSMKRAEFVRNGMDKATVDLLMAQLAAADGAAEANPPPFARAMSVQEKREMEKTIFLEGGAEERKLWDLSNQGDLNGVHQLLAKGANPNWQNPIRFGSTALIQASSNKMINVAVSLIKGKADVNSTDKRGTTPLMTACRNGDMPLVSLLLSSKANPSTKNKSDKSALEMALDARLSADVLSQISQALKTPQQGSSSPSNGRGEESISAFLDRLGLQDKGLLEVCNKEGIDDPSLFNGYSEQELIDIGFKRAQAKRILSSIPPPRAH